jgi:hypothetical protein
MHEAITAIDSDYGGIEAYLTGPAGMTPSALRALRSSLVARPVDNLH